MRFSATSDDLHQPLPNSLARALTWLLCLTAYLSCQVMVNQQGINVEFGEHPLSVAGARHAAEANC